MIKLVPLFGSIYIWTFASQASAVLFLIESEFFRRLEGIAKGDMIHLFWESDIVLSSPPLNTYELIKFMII